MNLAVRTRDYGYEVMDDAARLAALYKSWSWDNAIFMIRPPREDDENDNTPSFTRDYADQVHDLGYKMDRANAHFDSLGRMDRHMLRRYYQNEVSQLDKTFIAEPLALALKRRYGKI